MVFPWWTAGAVVLVGTLCVLRRGAGPSAAGAGSLRSGGAPLVRRAPLDPPADGRAAFLPSMGAATPGDGASSPSTPGAGAGRESAGIAPVAVPASAPRGATGLVKTQ